MSDTESEWKRVERVGSGRYDDEVVGIGPSGSFHVYKTACVSLFGDDPPNNIGVEMLSKRDGSAFAVRFDTDDPNYRLTGDHTISASVGAMLRDMGIDLPEQTVHLDFEWDEETQTMTVPLDRLR